MKQKRNITTLAAFVACSFLVMGGCTDKFTTPANLQAATRYVTAKVFKYVVAEKDKKEVAGWLYSGALGVRTLSAGKVPTPDELKATFKAFIQEGSKWNELADEIGDLWGLVYPSVKDNPIKAIPWLEAIAAGIEEVAKPFLYGQPLPFPTATP